MAQAKVKEFALTSRETDLVMEQHGRQSEQPGDHCYLRSIELEMK
jgi:hypothetical protein